MTTPIKSKRRELAEWALTIVIPVVLALLIHTFLFTFARVDGPSMLDTLQDNNILGVSRLEYRIHAPKRGQIVTCYYDPPTGSPFKTRKLMVKRIIGLPGETVEIKGGVLIIDGQMLAEDYLTRIDADDYGPYTVGAQEVFVLGDNRLNSNDSRFVGPIPLSYLYGQVVFVALPFSQMRSTTDVPLYSCP